MNKEKSLPGDSSETQLVELIIANPITVVKDMLIEGKKFTFVEIFKAFLVMVIFTGSVYIIINVLRFDIYSCVVIVGLFILLGWTAYLKSKSHE